MAEKREKKGFTLIELLIVISIIGILVVVVFILLDPPTLFAKARNSQRWSDVTAILHGIKHYQVDNEGELPPDFPDVPTELGDGSPGTYNLGIYLIPQNLPDVPYDPSYGSPQKTCYSVQYSGGIIIVRAMCAEDVDKYGNIELKW